MTEAVILAGGLGTRLSEETGDRPKPMVEIGGLPILWHIMKIYSHYGVNHFIVCLGYKGEVIKEFFSNYFMRMSDVTLDLGNNSVVLHNKRAEDWRVTLVDTGPDTMTGGRLKRVKDYIEEDTFFFTYGDGVGDVDIAETLKFHKEHDGIATVTAARPSGRFGAMTMDGRKVTAFEEKPRNESGYVNAGFFVLDKPAIDYVSGDSMPFEDAPLRDLAKDGKLHAYLHDGFWQPMDTLRDKNVLETLLANDEAPWTVWRDPDTKHG